MTGEGVQTLLGAVALGVGVPWLSMTMLLPALESSPAARTANYRGRTVFYGLGVVWLVWAGCALAGGIAGSGASTVAAPLLRRAAPLALVAFAVGLLDDAYGSGESRGFKGHLSAMLRGRLTTGGLKLIGIGSAALGTAFLLAPATPWGKTALDVLDVRHAWLARTAIALVAGAAIALTANLVNLTDLRPGRALKLYCVLAVGALVSAGPSVAAAAASAGAATLPSLVRELCALALFLAGPVLAVWHAELSERGMLGDAGANPMGAVAGMLIVTGLPLAGLVAYFLTVLALNLASERVSFSKVIAANRVLTWLDALGREGGREPDPDVKVRPDAHNDSAHV